MQPVVAAHRPSVRTRRARDAYYMVVFCYQGVPAFPQSAHTFAAFVRAAPRRRGTPKIIESKTISWLPATLSVRLISGPEPGRNLSLQETLNHAAAIGARVSAWGPFQIKKDLFDRAFKQATRLERGDVLYKAVDYGWRPAVAINCFHAICDLDTDLGLLTTGIAYGKSATNLVVNHLRRWMIQPEQTHPWLLEKLGLKDLDLVVAA